MTTHKSNSSKAFSNTINEYLLDKKVVQRPFDVITNIKGPFDLYSLKDLKNFKNKKCTQPDIIIGQSYEQGVSTIGGANIPSSYVAPPRDDMVNNPIGCFEL